MVSFGGFLMPVQYEGVTIVAFGSTLPDNRTSGVHHGLC